MAKGGGIGKLGKLKCMIKRWQSASGGHGRLPPSAGSSVSTTPAAAVDDDDASWPGAVLEGNQLQHGRSNKIINGGGDVEYYREAVAAQSGLRPVYVGKSRRRYLISSQLVDHPLFRAVLVQRSGRSGAAEDDDDEGSTAAAVVGCEVVLFEHLLWMLDNADDDPAHDQPESDLDELAEFYAC